MRSSLVKFLAALALLVVLNGAASATTLISDTFSYPNGDLTTQNDGSGPGDNVSNGRWISHGGAGFPTTIVVDNGKAVLEEGNPASDDAHRSAGFGRTIALGETWYYAAVVTIVDKRPNPANALLNAYFMHFSDGGTLDFKARSFVDNPNAGIGQPGFTFGLSSNSGTQNQKWPTDLAFGTPYKIVASYSVDTGFTNLWVNPVDASSAKISSTVTGAQLSPVKAINLRQAFAGTTPSWEARIDSVAFGTDFDSVFLNSMNGSNIPEPTTCCLALFGLAGLIGTRRSGKRS